MIFHNTPSFYFKIHIGIITHTGNNIHMNEYIINARAKDEFLSFIENYVQESKINYVIED
ncbi:hypothetical protein psyc5s11_20100 [Clostridium gelidum]|uniref:Transposase n=1 Tax=Clostridium gelidum TaxID=704125 RepID=A0ABM7T219_9CLOT|nr:hypothetical protein psyc5s11_20100 [Clostridium gelidum]